MRRSVAVLTVLVAASQALAWDVKLEVKELWGKPGRRFVSGGVPLLAGQAKEPGELRLATKGKAGQLVAAPAQFRVLARWWRGDNSIRWVLVDFQADLAANEAREFVLTNRADLKAPAPPAKLTVEQAEDQIVITTGPGSFVVGRKPFCFLNKAFVDGNGDGKFDESENLINNDGPSGAKDAAGGGTTIVEDTFGQAYTGWAGTKSVEVIESGPMRVCVRARGVHRAATAFPALVVPALAASGDEQVACATSKSAYRLTARDGKSLQEPASWYSRSAVANACPAGGSGERSAGAAI